MRNVHVKLGHVLNVLSAEYLHLMTRPRRHSGPLVSPSVEDRFKYYQKCYYPNAVATAGIVFWSIMEMA